MSSRLSAAATSDDQAAQAGRTEMMQVGYTLAIRPVPRCRYAKPGLTTGSPLNSGAKAKIEYLRAAATAYSLLEPSLPKLTTLLMRTLPTQAE